MKRLSWPALRQLSDDPLALGKAAQTTHSETLEPRTKTADRIVKSICPYCAVGCGQNIYVKDERIIQIEG
ncbi:MAG: dehydrogenase, partial [Candidatus Eremiobacteraeota bacterium]|nr:dehydrogenase [Candidatus Eremiobacteraeota bacterium]